MLLRSGVCMSGRNERARRRLAYFLLARLKLKRVVGYLHPRTALALISGFNGALSIALLAAIAMLTQEPFIFPSVGASAFILFYRPLVPAASPRNVLIGHAIGVLSGWFSLWIFGLLGAPSAFDVGMDGMRVAATAVGMGLTCALMVWLRAAHPPAAATSLLVSMGLISSLWHLPLLLAGASILVLQAFVMHRIAGVKYPYWSPQSPDGE